ncbi:hypothetical protein OG223_29640 [Streptomyces sp. NBC_01478]|uniref:hypothetical protein n=1 Tax=Streptomyces sp. NBC_01478 TaxID=2903882 RepID=UPI002E30622D|nr:hypothetical protein [Streptomyces sp. NBC_01478]
MQSIGQLSAFARESTLVHDMERAEEEARYRAARNGVDVAATMPVVALIMVSEDGGRLTVEVSAWEYGQDSGESGGPS